MQCSRQRCFATFVGVAVLWLFVTLQMPKEARDSEDVITMEGQETSYGSKNPRPLEDWHSITLKYMQKVKKRRKTWLTVGISAVSRQDPSSLLYTLTSLYNGSSMAEQKHLTVLVHLADFNLTWLQDTTERISSLFSPQILAGRLLLIHAPPAAYPTVDGSQGAHHGEGYSKQNVDHAFLLSFATKLSNYFLLIEDTVLCAPNFVSRIYSRVTTLNPSSWVLLEFSNVTLSGKLFHSRDLPVLAHFLLLFHQEKPLDILILYFRILLVQKNVILFAPFLFYHTTSHPTFSGTEYRAVQKKHPYGPSNPPAYVLTDMDTSDAHFPWEAYTLDESFFWTSSVRSGNHLTVILNHPARLSRVQVWTGTLVEGKYALRKGQVQLGYDPQGMAQDCSGFVLLGWLEDGQMDQEILQGGTAHPVSCVRLVVKEDQDDGLMVRHIYLWEKNAMKEETDQSLW